MSEIEPESIPRRVQEACELLEAILENRGLLAEVDGDAVQRLLIAAGRASRPGHRARRQLTRALRRKARDVRRENDQAILSRTGIRKLRNNPIFKTPRRLGTSVETPSEPLGKVEDERVCYTCQARYHEIHPFYDQLCPPCGDLNYAKRTPEADLSGRVALVTGSRVKIGFQAALMLLRAGCHVICTTRFPRDAARRYAAEEDFAEWGDRVEIHGIDLRHTPSVEALCATLNRTHSRLDFVINNACQTVRRPPGFYDHLMDGEREELPASESRLLAVHGAQEARALSAPEMTQIELVAEDAQRGHHLFPVGELDADLQQVDLREVNSWRLRHHEVPTVELLEVHLVNAVAPYVLNGRLKPLMLAVPSADKHIVNVSAMEGQFYRTFKSARHPHTNMAKASLNMMTRTSALDYIADGIHMNSVDTGWVTDEDPIAHAERKREEHDFHPPLDIIDGAARIVDPIFDGIATGKHVWGQFIKDYKLTDW